MQVCVAEIGFLLITGDETSSEQEGMLTWRVFRMALVTFLNYAIRLIERFECLNTMVKGFGGSLSMVVPCITLGKEKHSYSFPTSIIG
ncbi:MAG TPA: hypothetical protein ENK82_08765 [Campylobacterales bacterium]|nr:hypothetical protein [Campylobacterales bacterium]